MDGVENLAQGFFKGDHDFYSDVRNFTDIPQG
jgi:hypothetical protein